MSAQEPKAKTSNSAALETTEVSSNSAISQANGASARMPTPEPFVKSAFVLFGIFTVLTGLVYPALVTAVAQLVFPHQAEGSLVCSPLAVPSTAAKNSQVSVNRDSSSQANREGHGSLVVGSRLVGQAFSEPKYFWPRPSATTPAYNAAASSGSNLGPTNPDFLATVAKRVEFWRAQSHSEPSPTSSANVGRAVDTVTASSSISEKIPADIVSAKASISEKIPVDIVTASASGIDPDISPAAARLQISRVAKARTLAPEQVRRLIAEHTKGRDLGLLGEPRVNVLELNLALDQLTEKM